MIPSSDYSHKTSSFILIFERTIELLLDEKHSFEIKEKNLRNRFDKLNVLVE